MEGRELSYRDYYRMSPMEFRPGDRVAVKVVIVLGHDQDYAVYTGTTDQSDEEIAAFGDKLAGERGEQAAKAVFPSVAFDRHCR